MIRNRKEVERCVSSLQRSAHSPREIKLKGLFCAKLFYDLKDFEVARRHVSDYLTINEKDPKAHKLLGQIYEAEGDKVKAAGCFKRSLELNGSQKELVLKVAELLSEGRALQDGSAKYWVERAAKVFPGNPAVFSLKEKLLRMGGEPEKLETLLRNELHLRPHEPSLNVHLAQLLLDSGRLPLVLQHVRSADSSPSLRHALAWQSCVVTTLQGVVRGGTEAREEVRLRLLFALHHVARLSLGRRDIAEAVDALRSLDEELGGALMEEGSWSPVLGELKGQLYLHAGTLLLQMARDQLAQWRAVVDQAALCYMLSYQVDRIELKSKSKVVAGQDMDSLSCNRLSQAGHMLVTLCEGKPEDYLGQVAEALAGPAGQDALVKAVYAGQPPPCSLLASDDIPQQLHTQPPDMHKLLNYDTSAVSEHGGDLQQLVWLCLMWSDSTDPQPDHRTWLSPLFPKMKLETERLESNSGETIALLDVEVFLLGVTFAAKAQLEEKMEKLRRDDEPRLSPLPLSRLLVNDRQRQWWQAVHSLLNRQAQPGTLAKLRTCVQQELPVLRAHDKHGLQPSMLVHWADTLVRKGSAQRIKAARREYVARGAYYWEKALPMLQLVRRHKDVPEPIDPLFMHFHSRDIQHHETDVFIASAKLALGTLSLVREDYDDAVMRFEAVNTPLALWNCALLFHSLAEDADPGGEETDGPEGEECRCRLRKAEGYLLRVMRMLPDHDWDCPAEDSQAGVSVSSVRDLLDAVRARLEQFGDERSGDLDSGDDPGSSSVAASTRGEAATLSSPRKNFLASPNTSPRWAQQQKHMLEQLCHQIQGLQNSLHSLQIGTPKGASGVHSLHMVMEGSYPAETLTDSYQAPASFQQGTPLTVSTGGAPAFYNQSPGYNTQCLLRTTTPAKHPNMYGGIPRLTPQQPQQQLPPQHVFPYQQPPANTPPAPSSASRIYAQDVYGGSGYPHGSTYGYDSAVTGSMLSPYGNQFYEPPAPSNPALPEPGFFTMPPAHRTLDTPRTGVSPVVQGPPPGQPMQQQQQQPAFQFSNNFQSDDGDYTFSSPVASQGPGGSLTTGTPIRIEHLQQTASAQSKSFTATSSKAGPLQSQSQDAAPYFDVKALSGMSFADLAAQSLDKGMAFGQTAGGTNSYAFKDRGRPLFQQATPGRADDGSDGEVDSVLGEEDGPHFEPVVPLPDKVEVKTGEEDEEELYCNRAKLFRFDVDSKEWKERGVGNFKILRHHLSGKLRVLMRREQVLKICANHYITAEMTLNRNAGSDKSWVWHALDFADEVERHEQLAIKFKTVEEAAIFRTKFEEAQQLLKSAGSDGDKGDAPLALVKGFSKQSASKPARAVSQPAIFKATSMGFGAKFEKKEGEWDCSVCMVRNKPDANACVSCLSAKPEGDRPVHTPAVFATSVPGTSSSFTNFKFSSISAKNAAECPGSMALGSAPNFKLSTSSCLPFKAAQDNKTLAVASPTVSVKGFDVQFAKKEGQWDCEMCAVRNEGSATSCICCQTPKPGASPESSAIKECPPSLTGGTAFQFGLPPESDKQGGGFMQAGSGFAFGAGSDMATGFSFGIASGNSAASSTAKTIQPGSFSFTQASTSTPSSVESSKTPAFPKLLGFCSQFSKKEGEWDCDTCAVRNKPELTACAACQTNKPGASTIPSVVAKSDQAPATPKMLGFGLKFSKKEGEWDCDTCAVRNKPELTACAACQTRRTDAEPTDTPVVPFTGFGQSDSGFGLSMTGFSFGTLAAKTDEPGFSFGSLTPVAGQASAFKFASQEVTEKKGPCQPGSASLLLKILVEDHERAEIPSSKSGPSLVGGQGFTGSSFTDFKPSSVEGFQGFSGTSFADLATAQPVEFGKSQSSFSNFPGIGKTLFGVTADGDTSGQEDADEMYKTEEDDGIHFEPVVQMPDKVDLVTGEEEEEVCYSQRAKLFRFDVSVSQWKERGVGDIKILRNKQTCRTRILMRREQVLKVCANHCITTSMSLNPMVGSDRAWVWVANDFSEGEPKVEQLAVKFKTPEVGIEFKAKFEECQRALLDMPLQTPHKLLQTGKAAELIQKAEKMKSELKGFKEQFAAVDKARQVTSDAEALVTSTPTSSMRATSRPGPLSECVVPTLEWDDYDLREGTATCETSGGTSLLSSPRPPDKPDHARSDKPLFRFGETATGFNFSFQPIVSPGKSPAGHQHHNSTNEEDEEEEASREEDNLHFEPIVPLPALIDVRTGEEQEQEVFVHRAKLYRYDREAVQWKERGVGDVKLLQRLEDGRGRLIMRREQVLKICANHWITADTRLEPMRGSDRAWVWNALDSSDGEPQMEHLALRFKQPETAAAFRQAVLDIQEAQETRRLVPPVRLAPPTPTRVLSVLESAEPPKISSPATNDGNIATEINEPSSPPSPEKGSSAESTTSPAKSVISPAKFSFGSEALPSLFKFDKPAASDVAKSGAGFDFVTHKPGIPLATKFTFGSSSVANDGPGSSPFSFLNSAGKATFSFEPLRSSKEPTAASSFDITASPFSFAPSIGGGAADTGSDGAPSSLATKIVSKGLRGASPTRTSGSGGCFAFHLPQQATATSGEEEQTPQSKVDNLTEEEEEEEREADKVEVVWELSPTEEQRALAESLLLPTTFFCYKNKPGYSSDSDEEDEDFTMAVKNLKGKLYIEKESGHRRQCAAVPHNTVVVTVAGDAPEQEQGLVQLCAQGAELASHPEDSTPVEADLSVRAATPPHRAAACTPVDLKPAVQVSRPGLLPTPLAAVEVKVDAESLGQEAPCAANAEEEVVFSGHLSPTEEQRALALDLQLPPTFFCFKNRPGYTSDSGEDTDDYEQAVNRLRGKLYKDSRCQEQQQQSATVQTPGAGETKAEDCNEITSVDHPSMSLGPGGMASAPLLFTGRAEPDETSPPCVGNAPDTSKQLEEVKPTAGEVMFATLQWGTPRSGDTWSGGSRAVPPFPDAPSSSFASLASQAATEAFLHTAKESPQSFASLATLTSAARAQTPSGTTGDDARLLFSCPSGSGLSFADLASKKSDFLSDKKDANFSWAGAGASVFGVAGTQKKRGGEVEDADEGGEEEEEEDEAARESTDDIHFEPLVSLPEVEVRSGEEDETVLYKERAKLFRWDRDAATWKERGVGDIKVLHHEARGGFRVLMRREQVHKVCVNHAITAELQLTPMQASNNAFVWIANDYSEGTRKMEQFACRFKTPEQAKIFLTTVHNCQEQLKTQSRAVAAPPDATTEDNPLEVSSETNPLVFLDVMAGEEPLGQITIELFANVVPITAENFRALCTHEHGFGYHNSIIHRVIPGFVCQGGDFTQQNGTGGRSIYGKPFDDESFKILHSRAGILSMANSGRNTNTSQFFITLCATPHLDHKHVAFGAVRSGMKVVRAMEELGSRSGSTTKKIFVTASGEVKRDS